MPTTSAVVVTGNSHFYSTIQLNHQQQRRQSANVGQINLINQVANQEPPPPYRKRASSAIRKFIPPPPPPLRPPQQQQYQQRSAAPLRSQIRSRVEEYRNQNLSDSELSDSERHQQRHRNRSSSQFQQHQQPQQQGRNNFNRRSNEILLGKL